MSLAALPPRRRRADAAPTPRRRRAAVAGACGPAVALAVTEPRALERRVSRLRLATDSVHLYKDKILELAIPTKAAFKVVRSIHILKRGIAVQFFLIKLRAQFSIPRVVSGLE